MADINFGVAPYNDRFDPKKNRTKVLFRPDRPLQQSELNEMQSIAEHNLRQLGDRVFADGAMQTGMSFIIDEEAGTLTVDDGLVYMAGKVRVFKRQSIPFTGQGDENIGIRLVQRIIDHNEDPNLLDQTQGVASSLSSGADRLEEYVQLTVNDEAAPTLYEFVDGQLFLTPDRPEFSMLNEVLAQRTYEESGSYQVSGFNMWVEPSQGSDDTVDLVIDSGTAYVLGYRIHKPTSTRIKLKKSQEFNSVALETHTYSNTDRKFRIGSNSVKAVTQVLAVTNSPSAGIQVSKGTADGRDAIPAEYTSINRDTTVLWTNSPEQIFARGTDYTIVEENGVQYVNWNTGLNGREPATGVSYFMTFEYTRIMRPNIDYKAVRKDRAEGVPGWDMEIDFNGMTGHKPKTNGTVSVSYEFFLSRKDLITLDHTGKFTIIEGVPNRESEVASPSLTDPLTLMLGSVHVYPNSDLADATNIAVTRLRMEDLQRMKRRLENVEYNQAVQVLETQATKSQDPLMMRGVFVDSFTDFRKIDPNLTTVAFSLDDATITLMTHTPNNQKKKPAFNMGQSVASAWGRLVSAPFTERREISQPLASSAWNVNPYAVYNKQGVLKLTPEADNWIEEEKVTVHDEDQITTRLNRWWGHQREGDPMGNLSAQNQFLVDNTSLVGEQQFGSHFNRTSSVEGIMHSTAQQTRDEVIEYIRQREISFKATNLLPLTNNLALTFDGISIPIIPTGDTVAGQSTGTVRSNSKGEVTGKFMIPSGIRTGTREVTLQNNDNMASSVYVAQGTRKITTETITKTRVTFNLFDPLAQSFAFPSSRVVTSVGVYFGSKPTTDNLIMQIRGLSEGGNPNRTVYAERMLTPADINVSEDASVETKIALDDPLIVDGGQSYCAVFLTDSTDYTMWAATMGEPRIDRPSETIVAQPFVNGVLFSSSNAVTWTPHQETDLKFHIYTAEFNEQGVIEFDPMENIDSNGILLMASYLTPANTGCYWEVKVVNGADVGVVSIDSVPWVPLANYTELRTPFVVGLAKLRATFKASRYISPFLALDDLMFVNFVTETSGDYVSLNIDSTDAPFNKITFAYDAYAPSGSSITPKYSTDGGATWKSFTVTPSTSRQSAEFTRFTFDEKISTNATNTQIKFKLELRGENRFVSPRARRLTALWKDEFTS